MIYLKDERELFKMYYNTENVVQQVSYDLMTNFLTAKQFGEPSKIKYHCHLHVNAYMNLLQILVKQYYKGEVWIDASW